MYPELEVNEVDLGILNNALIAMETIACKILMISKKRDLTVREQVAYDRLMTINDQITAVEIGLFPESFLEPEEEDTE